MSERKAPTRYIPLRVRFRPAVDPQQSERDPSGIEGDIPRFPSASSAFIATPPPMSESERRIRQMKELLHFCDMLRADLTLDDMLQRIATSLTSCTGFRSLTVNLMDEDGKQLRAVSFVGVAEEDQRFLLEHPFTIDTLLNVMRPQFRISQSYFIPHDYIYLLSETTVLTVKNMDKANHEYERGQWHPYDHLIVPLYSSREQKLLGCFFLDDPEDKKVPTMESIEMVELFASKVALAIDNIAVYQTYEHERKIFTDGLAILYEDLDIVRRGNLRHEIQETSPTFKSLIDLLNDMISNYSVLVHDFLSTIVSVDTYFQGVRRFSDQLIQDMVIQEQRIQQVSQAVGEISNKTKTISESSSQFEKTATEAVDVVIDAQGTVDRAVEGMGRVREATMQSNRAMKNLGESGQEINETILAMTDLTTRMHLLSLNAAIEATRAGEHGRGFAPIAQEIRTLALNCSEAARKIAAYIRTIQQETSTVSKSIEHSSQQVIMQTELVTQTGVALEAINVITDRLNQMAQEISKATEGQTQGSQQVMQALGGFTHLKNTLTEQAQEMQKSVSSLVEITGVVRSRMSIMQLRDHS